MVNLNTLLTEGYGHHEGDDDDINKYIFEQHPQVFLAIHIIIAVALVVILVTQLTIGAMFMCKARKLDIKITCLPKLMMLLATISGVFYLYHTVNMIIKRTFEGERK